MARTPTSARRSYDRRPSPSQVSARRSASPGRTAPEPPAPEPPAPRRGLARLAGVLAGVLLFGAGALTASGLGGGSFPPEALAALAPSPEQVNSGDSRGMRAVIDALKARERALDRRERTIDARESDLRQVESDLSTRLAELQALRETLQEMLKQSDDVREARIKQLTKMVESMRAKQAAGVFAELDDDLAVEVLRRMNKAKAGKAMAAMDPVRAAKLGELLTRSPVQEMAP